MKVKVSDKVHINIEQIQLLEGMELFVVYNGLDIDCEKTWAELGIKNNAQICIYGGLQKIKPKITNAKENLRYFKRFNSF